MTPGLSAWVEAATGGLPAGVVSRVAAEAGAHVQDAVEAGVPEAQAVRALGDPGQVRRALGRTYLTEERMRELREGPARFVPLVTWGLPAFYVFTAVLAGVLAPPFGAWRLTAPLVTLVLLALLGSLTRRLPTERRALLVTMGAVAGPLFLQGLSWILAGRSGEAVPWPWLSPLTGALLVMMLGSTLREDARLRRTLSLSKG